MTAVGWLLLAGIGVGGFVLVRRSPQRETVTVRHTEQTPKGTAQIGPFGPPPAQQTSWTEDVREGIATAREAFDFGREVVGIFT